jgi:hypothetical protein
MDQELCQENVGGLRVLEIINPPELENQAWELGYNWVDYTILGTIETR